MTKKYIILSVISFITLGLSAQKYVTKTGHINFFSSTPIEDISADNNQVVSMIDLESGSVQFACIMKSFQFEKALMQEHFNDNYVESHKFPNAKFVGKIADVASLNLAEGKQTVKVDGKLTLHGVTKDISVEGTLEKSGDELMAVSDFIAKPADFEIKIPATVKENIAKEIKVTMKSNLKAR